MAMMKVGVPSFGNYCSETQNFFLRGEIRLGDLRFSIRWWLHVIIIDGMQNTVEGV